VRLPRCSVLPRHTAASALPRQARLCAAILFVGRPFGPRLRLLFSSCSAKRLRVWRVCALEWRQQWPAGKTFPSLCLSLGPLLARAAAPLHCAGSPAAQLQRSRAARAHQKPAACPIAGSINGAQVSGTLGDNLDNLGELAAGWLGGGLLPGRQNQPAQVGPIPRQGTRRARPTTAH